VCPVLDAKRKQVHSALFRWREGRLQRLWEDKLLEPGELVDLLSKEPVVFLGDALKLYGDFLCRHLGGKALLAPSHLQWPRASSVAVLGVLKLAIGEKQTPETLLPNYVRRPAAEVKWDAQHNG